MDCFLQGAKRILQEVEEKEKEVLVTIIYDIECKIIIMYNILLDINIEILLHHIFFWFIIMKTFTFVRNFLKYQ